jgi:hypothetical protein
MERFLSEMMIEDVHEAASRNVLVCYGCVAMPGLVNLGRSRKEDKVNSSTATTHKRGYVAQQAAMKSYRPDFVVYVNLQEQCTSILSY